MERLKEIIKRIKELANSFINPIPPEPTFEELALASDLDQTSLAQLQKTRGGINWDFSEQNEEVKKGKSQKVTPKDQIESTPKNIVYERNNGEER